MATVTVSTTLEVVRRDDGPTMPSLNMPTLTGVDVFTTPTITVPPNLNNPYILRQENPTGTVFIAVGAIVGAMLLGFILYHLIVSFAASRLAKKNAADEKQLYEKYNNHSAYGLGGGLTPTTSTGFGSEYQPSVAKLPLLTPSMTMLSGFGTNFASPALANGSQVGDTSTIYQSEVGVPASKHDLTKMFISPTAEVMQHKRVRSSSYGGSITNLSFIGVGAFNGSSSNLVNIPGHRNSQGVYQDGSLVNVAGNRNSHGMYNNGNNSDYSVTDNHRHEHATDSSHTGGIHAEGPRSARKQIPSMYLEDLIDNVEETK
ncbi:uncharacterized protein RJT20DRAFT_133451 [Scheffersomyces xylosifermentans]|uniref:uncharacterized protein n=1 Tax=Scheffersomyces xylosifermentans TaxID=1304137 RepID=UPI00315D31FB